MLTTDTRGRRGYTTCGIHVTSSEGACPFCPALRARILSMLEDEAVRDWVTKRRRDAQAKSRTPKATAALARAKAAFSGTFESARAKSTRRGTALPMRAGVSR